MLDLNGRHALVCGSTQGIGKATAAMLHRQGARVTLMARDEQKLIATAKEIGGPDQPLHIASADFANPDGVRVAAEAVARGGPVEILVNNTGGPPAGALLDAEGPALEQAFAMHVRSSQLLVQALVPGMRARGYGRIINIVSTSVREPIPGLGVSNVMRAAVAGWAKTLSKELGPDGITVNNILPGFTETGRLASLIESRAGQRKVPPEQVADEMRAGVPLRRFADPDEVAAAIVFLASAEAAYISGVSLPVDGGRLSGI